MKRELSQNPTAIYGRGYSAAKRELGEMRRKWGEAFERLRLRAERAERGSGLGQCQGCAFWQRQDRCHWGYCDAKRAMQSPAWPMPWAHVECVKNPCHSPSDRFCTFEVFGCVNFKAKAGPPNEG